jgi:hypothetical protein
MKKKKVTKSKGRGRKEKKKAPTYYLPFFEIFRDF